MKTLRQFASDRTATQHHHAFGDVVEFHELVPKGVARHIPHVAQARQRRHKGLGASGDNNGAGGQSLLATAIERDLHCPGIQNFCIPLQHLHAQAGITLHAVVRLNGGDHAVDALHHRLEAELGLGVAQPIVGAVFHLVGKFGAFDQRFARHTTVVKAIAAHFVGFNQCHFGLHRRRNIGRHQPARAAANHHKIAVKRFRLEMVPAGVNLPRLDGINNFFGNQRENAQENKRADQARRQNAFERINLGQLRARVHVNRRAQQHAHLADPVKRPGLHLGEAHHQVDDEKRHQGHQAQGEEVKSALFFHTLVDLRHAVAKLVLHGFAQDKTRREEGQCGADAGGKRDDQRAHTQPENRATHQRHDGRAWQR